MNIQRLKEKVLEDIYPKEAEIEESNDIYQNVSNFIEKNFELKTHFAGSTGRGTCLKNDKDIDIFVLFPKNTKRKGLEEKGLEIGKKVFEEFNGSYRVDYAEHPYTKGTIEGHEVEIVPCFDVKSEDIKSSVDRTPHHSTWVSDNLNKDLKKDAVLLKKFLKSNKLYGSSLKRRGFSGYLTEILVIEYGGFEEVIEKAQNWDESKIIDPGEILESNESKVMERFNQDSLVVIDPIDKERNVAAVLSEENYAKFVHLCWKFSKDPGIEFFEEEKYEYTEFELKKEVKERSELVVVEFDRPDEVDDIIYPQMRKFMRLMQKRLKKHDFRIFESGFHSFNGKIRFFYEINRCLPEVQEIEGPRVFHNTKHVNQFTSKYDLTYVKEDRLVAKTERKYSDGRKLIKNFLNSDAEELKKNGVPNNISSTLTDHSFKDPVSGDEEWLNYLAEKLKV